MVYILTGEIQQGKTSSLKEWIKTHPSVAGILSPSIRGEKFLEQISTSIQRPLGQPISVEDSLFIGRYRLSKAAFAWGKDILKSELELNKEWFILDELGPLELKNEGFEPIFSNCILPQLKIASRHTLLVVRNRLVCDVIEKYELRGASIITQISELHI